MNGSRINSDGALCSVILCSDLRLSRISRVLRRHTTLNRPKSYAHSACWAFGWDLQSGPHGFAFRAHDPKFITTDGSHFLGGHGLACEGVSSFPFHFSIAS